MNDNFYETNKEYIIFLTSAIEMQVWEIMESNLPKNDKYEKAFKLISAGIALDKATGNKRKYDFCCESVREFFDELSNEDMAEYIGLKEAVDSFAEPELNEELFKWFLDFEEVEICTFINEVLNDNEADPEFSAVTCVNEIKSFITVKSQLYPDYFVSSVKDFLVTHKFTDEEYEQFERSRSKESAYFRSKQL